MNASTTTATHTARRKTGVCTCCATVIAIGQRYERYRYFSDCGPSTMTNHPDCARLFRESEYQEWDCDGEDFAELLGELNLAVEIVKCRDPAVAEAWREIFEGRER